MAFLEVRHICKSFGRTEVLKGIDFSLEKGEVLSIIGSSGSGNTTLYAHMSSRKVSVGAYVNQGDVLGITGSTGNSTGPHLHFEISENGVRINPLTYLTGYTLAG